MRHWDGAAKRRLKVRELRAIVGGERREKRASARSMNSATPASRAPGVSSVGMICAVTASTSAASAALRKNFLFFTRGWCVGVRLPGLANFSHPNGRPAAPIAAAIACSSDRRERCSSVHSMIDDRMGSSPQRIQKYRSVPNEESAGLENLGGVHHPSPSPRCVPRETPHAGACSVRARRKTSWRTMGCVSVVDRRDKIAQSQRPPGSGRCGCQCLARQSWRTW